ncbi:MAG: methyltransferase domain-containing protein [Pseudomonadota bacterium]
MSGEPNDKPRLFDAQAWIRARERAMRNGYLGGGDVFARLVAERIGERLEDVNRAFPSAVLAGTGAGILAGALPAAIGRRGQGLAMTDPSPAMLAAAAQRLPEAEALTWRGETLPFEPGRAALAVSFGLLHWLEDPVGHLVQLRLALAPDGLMIAVMAGGQSLAALRAALASAEAEVTGGLRPRVAPMGEIRDLGALLQRAGFQMPVSDSERLTMSHSDALALMRDLRAMGETNALAARSRSFTPRSVLMRAAALYAETQGTAEGRVVTEIELVFLTGWSPGPDQPTARRPGSASARLADALGTTERSAGEKATGGAGPPKKRS